MKIDYVMSDQGDWEGLYVNGKLMAEGHGLSVRDVVEALGFEMSHREIVMDAYGMNHLPSGFDELPK